jgi:hypothetical protein
MKQGWVTVLALVGALVAGQARAVDSPTLAFLREWDQGEAAHSKLKPYVNGLVQGIFANDRLQQVFHHAPPLFCVSPTVLRESQSLDPDQAVEIIRAKFKARPNNEAVALILAQGLKDTFPCPK